MLHVVQIEGLAKVSASVFINAKTAEEAQRKAYDRINDPSVRWEVDGVVEAKLINQLEVV